MPKDKPPKETGSKQDGKFPPGESGNPNGRPKKGTSVAELLRATAGEILSEGPHEGKTRAQAIADVLTTKAVDGDLKAIDMLYDRTDGKPHQTIAQTNDTKAEVRVID